MVARGIWNILWVLDIKYCRAKHIVPESSQGACKLAWTLAVIRKKVWCYRANWAFDVIRLIFVWFYSLVGISVQIS